VGVRADDVDLPEGVCDPKYPGGICHITLDKVLSAAGLPAVRRTRATPAHYRLVTKSCPPCELKQWISADGPGDCGTLSNHAWANEDIGCVRSAIQAKRPFIVRLENPTVDFTYVRAFVADGGSNYELWFNDRPQACEAKVDRRSCDAIALSTGPRWIECKNPSAVERLCDQENASVETLGPRRSLEELRCHHGGAGEMDCLPPGKESSCGSDNCYTTPDKIDLKNSYICHEIFFGELYCEVE
jgi:hypothetical protein